MKEDFKFSMNNCFFLTFYSFWNFLFEKVFPDIFVFYLGFVSRTFTNHRTAWEGGVHFFNSSLALPPASQTLRHQPGDYCRELTSAHSQQPDSNWEPLVSERRLPTTSLRALTFKFQTFKSFSLSLYLILNFVCNRQCNMSIIFTKIDGISL